MDVEPGSAYVFKWVDFTRMTGMCVRNKDGWVTLRIKGGALFSVPIEDIIQCAPLCAPK